MTMEAPDSKKQKLSGEDLVNLKKELRERKKRLAAIPRLTLLAAGESASLLVNTSDEDRIPIFLSDIQHLLLYSMLGHHTPYMPERWCKLEKYNKVSHTVVLIIEGLSFYHFVHNEAIFQHLNLKFEHKLELITPSSYGGSLIEDLAGVPLSGSQKKNLIKDFGSLESAAQGNGDIIRLLKTIFPIQRALGHGTNTLEQVALPITDKFSRTDLILSPWQLVEENYPIPLKGGLAKRYADYVLTKGEYIEVNPKSPMFALDCEMCKTTTGQLELTRISIVDEKLNVLYDTLVNPSNIITDYLTQYSGITKEMMQNVTTSLSDVQKFIRALLPPDAILVGQSLNSDMHALRMMHPYIIDTSVIFNLSGDRYRKTKLKILAQEFLREKIQSTRKGHCSTEDSKASMKLVQLKLANSICFGDSVLIDHSHEKSHKSHEKNKRDSNSSMEKTCTLGFPIFSHLTKASTKTSAIYCNGQIMNIYSKFLKNSSLKIMDDKAFQVGDDVRLFIAESNREAVRRCSEVAMEHALNFCHVKFEDNELSDGCIENTLTSVEEWIKKLWRHTALHGLVCVIFSGETYSSNGICFLNIKKTADIETYYNENESS